MSVSDLSEKQREQEALVAEWLLATPGFFDRHKDLLASVQLKVLTEIRLFLYKKSKWPCSEIKIKI
jgi:hypothetical protein